MIFQSCFSSSSFHAGTDLQPGIRGFHAAYSEFGSETKDLNLCSIVTSETSAYVSLCLMLWTNLFWFSIDTLKKLFSRHDPLFAGRGGGMLSDCPVPWEQQPVNEYQSLVEMGLFSWATDDDVWAYIGRLTAVGIAVSLLVAWPVVALSINPQQELVKCCVGALSGGVLASTMISLRLYLGWAYIGNRLFSATVECEFSEQKTRSRHSALWFHCFWKLIHSSTSSSWILNWVVAASVSPAWLSFFSVTESDEVH